MLSVQSLQAFSASALARGPDGALRLAQPAAAQTTAQAAGQDSAPINARGTSPSVPMVPTQGPPPTNLPRGALFDRVV
jgi:hypothetical protein